MNNNSLFTSSVRDRASLIKGRREITLSGFQLTNFLAKVWVWPLLFLSILLYSNLGPILWFNRLISQKFNLLCPEYIRSTVLYLSCGYVVFLLGYYTCWSRFLPFKMLSYVLDTGALDRFRSFLYLLIAICLGSLVYINWPLSNFWSSPFARGTGQFEPWKLASFLTLIPLFVLPMIGFISGFFYRYLPSFGGIVTGIFFIASLNLLALQSRGIFIMTLLCYGLGRLMLSPVIQWGRNLLRTAAICLLCLLALDFIGHARNVSHGTGIYNTMGGLHTYLDERRLFDDSGIRVFPESGDMHYLTKVMDLNKHKSYMPLSEFLVQLDPLPSIFGRYLYWPEEKWFTMSIGLWGKAGAPLPFGAIAYAGLGFWGIVTFFPVGMMFRLAQIQISTWSKYSQQQKIISFVSPLFAIVVIISTLICFAHGGIRSWIRFLINFFLFIFILKTIGILVADRQQSAYLSIEKPHNNFHYQKAIFHYRRH